MQGEGGEEEREIQTRGIHVLRHSPTQGDTLGFTKSQLLTYKTWWIRFPSWGCERSIHSTWSWKNLFIMFWILEYRMVRSMNNVKPWQGKLMTRPLYCVSLHCPKEPLKLQSILINLVIYLGEHWWMMLHFKLMSMKLFVKFVITKRN